MQKDPRSTGLQHRISWDRPFTVQSYETQIHVTVDFDGATIRKICVESCLLEPISTKAFHGVPLIEVGCSVRGHEQKRCHTDMCTPYCSLNLALFGEGGHNDASGDETHVSRPSEILGFPPQIENS